MDDLGFVQRCIKGDKLAWNEFVDRYSRLIYNYIHSVLKTKTSRLLVQEDINDLFQEVFLLLTRDNFKKLRTFKARNGCSLASWLRQVVINCSIDYLRKSKFALSLDKENSEELSLKDMLVGEAIFVREALVLEERFTHLKDCIESLDTDDKYFLELHVNRSFDLEKLRGIFKVSRGAIDMRKSRIVRILRDCFKSKGFQLDF